MNEKSLMKEQFLKIKKMSYAQRTSNDLVCKKKN